ncbi:class II fructose-bisphosphate aldolase [Thermodesulforhabdus norvegica]|uniref:Fructose/tagatose bisphosphate aldolase n=1 Tax=Thermodesulforhabdus norvegica TaxID=39841 RepID=A0A1I4VXB8_9BACT|nr:class II fructose-bisphosphate aldolase [Thermodesulforhabdus norvegica]SFN05968.1 Fructose/tagatose bisphosphate aldolase [Thermodesulforhabdus norvegica]
MMKRDLRPENVKKRFPDSIVPLVNGKALIMAARKHGTMIMATNIRCRLPVEGIIRASMATGAPVMYEIAKSELGYTEFTPASFVEFIVRENERLGNTRVPFAIHGDHITVKNPLEKEPVRALIAEELEAGFTSFAIDASHMENELNLEATADLARPIVEQGFCLEVELGEIGAKSGSAEGFTRPDEAEWFIRELVSRGIHPDLLAINNGSIHGTYFGAAQEGIQLDLTLEIWKAIQPWSVDIAQHGITGTSLEKISSFINYGIRKGNVGTFWQNITFGFAMNQNGNAITTEDKGYVKRPYRGIPDELWEEIWAWAKETGNVGGNIKKANKVFAAKLNAIGREYKERITWQVYEEAVKLFEATRSIGLADEVWACLEELG